MKPPVAGTNQTCTDERLQLARDLSLLLEKLVILTMADRQSNADFHSSGLDQAPLSAAGLLAEAAVRAEAGEAPAMRRAAKKAARRNARQAMAAGASLTVRELVKTLVRRGEIRVSGHA